jgi:SAM-dependent methyltransferase
VRWIRLEPGWRTLPFATASTDAVSAASVLEYVPDPATVLRECSRVLRPGGILVCTVPDLRHPIRWGEWLTSRATRPELARRALSSVPQLRPYLSYLQVSRHRPTACWWREAGAQAGLYALAGPAPRSPLRMFIFARLTHASPGESGASR